MGLPSIPYYEAPVLSRELNPSHDKPRRQVNKQGSKESETTLRGSSPVNTSMTLYRGDFVHCPELGRVEILQDHIVGGQSPQNMMFAFRSHYRYRGRRDGIYRICGPSERRYRTTETRDAEGPDYHHTEGQLRAPYVL